MVVDVVIFELVAGADVDAFLAADAAVQEDVMVHDKGFVRRTTARTAVHWLELTLWWSYDDAEAASARGAATPERVRFEEFIDPTTLRFDRFETLD